MNHSPPGSSVHGFFQARLLMWVAVSYSRRSLWTPHFFSSSSVPPPLFFFLIFQTCSWSFPLFKVFFFLQGSLQGDCVLSRVWIFAIHCTVARQPPLSMGFPGRNTRASCHFPPPGYLPSLVIECMSPLSPVLEADSLPTKPSGTCARRSESQNSLFMALSPNVTSQKMALTPYILIWRYF